MNRKNLNRITKFNIVLVCIFLTVSASFAAYTSLSNAKRTVSTTGSNQLFSSNILTEYENNNIQRKSIAFSADTETNGFYLTLYNYAKGDKTKWSLKDINYTMTVLLQDKNGTKVTDTSILSQYKLYTYEGNTGTEKAFSELSGPITGLMSSNSATEERFKFIIPTALMKTYDIVVTAESGISGYKPIGRIISVSEDVAASEWRLSYLDEEINQKSYDLGCINTRLTGSTHANLTIKWNQNYLQIDPWFLQEHNLTASQKDANGFCQITFEVGGTDTSGNLRPNQYNVIFYRTKAATSSETWEAIKGYIQVSSVKITN